MGFNKDFNMEFNMDFNMECFIRYNIEYIGFGDGINFRKWR